MVATSRFPRACWFFAMSFATAGVLASPTHADNINISATAFALRTASGSSDVTGEGGNGLLQNATGKYFAPVVFPVNGVNICSFALALRDFDVDFDVSASLLRKSYTLGGSAFTPPAVLASVGSTGAIDAVRRRATNTVATPKVNNARAYYYVELDVPASTLQVLGVEIVYKPTCP